MNAVCDIKKSTLALKAGELMIAFVGFTLSVKDQIDKEGVLKISAFYRGDAPGYLTLTFIIDTEGDPSISNALESVFHRLTEESIRPYMGSELGEVITVPLDFVAESHNWFIHEISLYFAALKNREKLLTEDWVIPAVAACLGLTFETVQWWQGDEESFQKMTVPETKKLNTIKSLKQMFNSWFSKPSPTASKQ